MRTGEQAPPPPGLTALHPLGEKDTISCGNPFDWKFERAAALSRSPGVVLAEILVPDDADCPFVDAVSDGAGVGRSAPLHPLGDGVREGCDPLALSRGLFDRNFGFRENARGVPLGTEAGESHIFTSRFRRSFSLQRNACTALFRWTGCERSSHPVAPKNGEFMKLID